MFLLLLLLLLMLLLKCAQLLVCMEQLHLELCHLLCQLRVVLLLRVWRMFLLLLLLLLLKCAQLLVCMEQLHLELCHLLCQLLVVLVFRVWCMCLLLLRRLRRQLLLRQVATALLALQQAQLRTHGCLALECVLQLLLQLQTEHKMVKCPRWYNNGKW